MKMGKKLQKCESVNDCKKSVDINTKHQKGVIKEWGYPMCYKCLKEAEAMLEDQCWSVND
jgi:hypothetical protein